MSMCIDEAKTAHCSEIIFTIKYILNTESYYHIKLESNMSRPWELCEYSDAEYVGDNNTHKRIT